MKTLTLFLALACAAMAQFTTNVPGVMLTGPVADPTIEKPLRQERYRCFVDFHASRSQTMGTESSFHS